MPWRTPVEWPERRSSSNSVSISLPPCVHSETAAAAARSVEPSEVASASSRSSGGAARSGPSSSRRPCVISAAVSTSRPSRRARRAPGRPVGGPPPGAARPRRRGRGRCAWRCRARCRRRAGGPTACAALAGSRRCRTTGAPAAGGRRDGRWRADDQLRRLRVRVRGEDRELVAAQPARERVGQLLGGDAQRARHRLERPVAAVVAAALVERLEVVDVAQHQRRLGRPLLDALEHELEPLDQRVAVREPRQPVLERERGHAPVQLGARDARRHLAGDRGQQPHVALGEVGQAASRVAHSSPQAASPSIIGTATQERAPIRSSSERSSGCSAGSSTTPT